MKKLFLLLLACFLQTNFLLAQNANFKLPSLKDGNAIQSIINSPYFSTVIFVLAGLAALLAVFVFISNAKMAYEETHANNQSANRYRTPADALPHFGVPGSLMGEFLPQLVPVDNELEEEEEDPRAQNKGQRD